MEKSTSLPSIIDSLASKARLLNLSDKQWAARAGVRNETLSRLRRRPSCDFATLQSLARVVGASVAVIDDNGPGSTEDGRFPAQLHRQYEEQLLDLCASGDLTLQRWRSTGPAFFMSGLAVMVASHPEFDRRSLLDLAEALHAGSSQVGVFALWLKGSPIHPSRFLPMLSAGMRHAA